MASAPRVDEFPAYFTIANDTGPTIALNPSQLTSVSTPISIRWVNEGAANVVWKVTPRVEASKIALSHQPFLDNKLLRLRKGTKSSDHTGNANAPPPFISTDQVYNLFTWNIKPLFQDDQIVAQYKVAVTAALVKACNSVLDGLEAANIRPLRRRGWHIEHNERAGLLITSMYPITPSSIMMLMKPKWLVQSPTAPPLSRRCRTCALQAQRGNLNPRTSICPLGLASGEEKLVYKELAKIPEPAPRWPPAPPGAAGQLLTRSTPEFECGDLVPALTKYFTGDGKGRQIVLRLRELQKQHDPKGVMGLYYEASTLKRTADDGNYNNSDKRKLEPCPTTTRADLDALSMAMALRDCTLFVRFTRDAFTGKYEIEARLADLDPKSGDDVGRLGKWFYDEARLINEGWYDGKESAAMLAAMGAVGPQHRWCVLWRDEENDA